jgi:hypothetical protein
MKVSDLIEALKKCPQDLEVMLYYDGDARLICDAGFILKNKVVYSNTDEPDEIIDALVLCQKEDVYGFPEKDSEAWVFGASK